MTRNTKIGLGIAGGVVFLMLVFSLIAYLVISNYKLKNNEQPTEYTTEQSNTKKGEAPNVKEQEKKSSKLVKGKDYNYLVRKTAKRIYVHDDMLLVMGQKPYNSAKSIIGACGEKDFVGNQWCQIEELMNTWPDYTFTKVDPKENPKFAGYWYCEQKELLIHQFNLVQVYEEFIIDEERYSWSHVHLFNDSANPSLCEWYFKGPKSRSCIDPKKIKVEDEG